MSALCLSWHNLVLFSLILQNPTTPHVPANPTAPSAPLLVWGQFPCPKPTARRVNFTSLPSALQTEPFLPSVMGTTEATLRMESVDVKEEWQDEDFPG